MTARQNAVILDQSCRLTSSIDLVVMIVVSMQTRPMILVE